MNEKEKGGGKFVFFSEAIFKKEGQRQERGEVVSIFEKSVENNKRKILHAKDKKNQKP